MLDTLQWFCIIIQAITLVMSAGSIRALRLRIVQLEAALGFRVSNLGNASNDDM